LTGIPLRLASQHYVLHLPLAPVPGTTRVRHSVVERLRFRPPRYLRYLWLTVALLQLIGYLLDHRPLGLVQTVIWTGVTALWWFAMDTVVDDDGVRTQGKWFRERVAWHEIRRFAIDTATRKPVLVLHDGRRKKLAYVPDPAWEDIQCRWQQATADAPTT